ncbi:MAG: site-2 protease family protein [Anaerolineae bacterium]|nr:site-2 protease family protein [Anaerolineae bacterium]
MDWINIGFWVVGTLIAVLGPMILLHELGHFIAAKLTGVRVEEFGFGFPPRMLKLWHGKGYFDIGSTRIVVPRRLKGLPARLLVGSCAEAITSQRQGNGTYILHQLTMLDEETEDVSPKREMVGEEVRTRGEVTEVERGTIYSLNWLPMGAFVRLTGEETDFSDPHSLVAKPKLQRILVMGAGAALNILAAFVLMVSVYLTGLPERWVVQVYDVMPGTAAEEAGLQPRDVILAVDGERLEEGPVHLQRIIQAAPERPTQLTVLRDDREIAVTTVPRPRECQQDETGCVAGTGFLGITMNLWPDRTSLRHYNLFEATQASIADLTVIAQMIATLPAQLVKGTVTIQEARPVSVVGASQILTFFLQQSLEWQVAFPVLRGAALISLALGLTNLLPLPAFDGGRILFVLIEAVRGRRIAPEREAVVHFVGMVILIVLMGLVMFYDIINPVISWSWLSR